MEANAIQRHLEASLMYGEREREMVAIKMPRSRQNSGGGGWSAHTKVAKDELNKFIIQMRPDYMD